MFKKSWKIDGMGTSSKNTPKASRTKEHILSTALELFAKKGYTDTTLRDIATEAKVSLGLTYRYFSRKEDLVLALYERLGKENADEAVGLPRAPLAARFTTTINACLDRLQPHRSALGSLFAVGLSANSEMAVLGNRASGVRSSMWDLYRSVVNGSSDAPKPRQAEEITTILYAAHLLVVLFWLQDQSEGQQRTRELVKVASSMLKRLRPILAFPMASKFIADLHRVLFPMFGPPAKADTAP